MKHYDSDMPDDPHDECREEIKRLEAELAASPSWQDRPTGPGLWFHSAKQVWYIDENHMQQAWVKFWNNGTRVFGPIPADTRGTETK